MNPFILFYFILFSNFLWCQTAHFLIPIHSSNDNHHIHWVVHRTVEKPHIQCYYVEMHAKYSAWCKHIGNEFNQSAVLFFVIVCFYLELRQLFFLLYFCLILPHTLLRLLVHCYFSSLDGKREREKVCVCVRVRENENEQKIQYFLNAQCHTSYIEVNKIYFETKIRI